MISPGAHTHIAFFDLDHTILTENSATHLIREARVRGIMSDRHFRQAVYLSILYKLGIGDSSRMIVRMLSWLKGLPLKEVQQLCRGVFESTLSEMIRPEITRRMDRHRRDGGAVVLLSSASGPVCDPVSRHLRMDDVICSTLEERDGVLTGNTDGRLVYGWEKKIRLEAYCRDTDHSPATAYYYGDSHSDRHVMLSTGYPVAVDPDRRLCKLALEHNWEILLRNRA